MAITDDQTAVLLDLAAKTVREAVAEFEAGVTAGCKRLSSRGGVADNC
jgi:hypothetical protein